MIIQKYYNEVLCVLKRINSTQIDKIEKVAELVADVIKDDGIIYIFGCGHSHLIGLDAFYRAGGLANVCAMLDTDLMLHNGAAKSSKMEKMSGIAKPILDRYCLTKKDMLIVVSTSGKNTVPVEMAVEAQKRRIPTVGIFSSAYFDDVSDKGRLLSENVDVGIDNCVCYGDAVIDVPACKTKMGSVSTVASSFIIQSLLLEGAAKASEKGYTPSVYMSGNVPGGSEFNKEIINNFYPRIKHL